MELHTIQELQAPREAVFGFFADATQLQRITPPWLHFRIVTPPPIEMAEGTLIDYRLRLHGFPIRWRTLISEWSPQERFVDEQIRGPYRQWHHTHDFEATPRGTLVRDTVRYRVPAGWLIERFFVRRQLRRIFNFRRDALEQIFAEA